MASVISCSRRTDIPAFYTPWLINRLRAGFCHTFNPFGGQVYSISLRPEDVIALTFWTRSPAPLLPYLDELDRMGYTYYFTMSILGYPRAIEPHSPPVDQVIRTARMLSERISPERIRWRYDPIVLSEVTSADYHLRQFEKLSGALEGSTRHCTISFVQFYEKTTRNLGAADRDANLSLRQPGLAEQQDLAAQLAQIANARGMSLNSCCNDLLAVNGVQKAHCIDADLITALAGSRADGLKAKATRPDCGCAASVDIGVYDTCLFGCTYCYATRRQTAARQRHREHDSSDSMLWRPEKLRGVDLESLVKPTAIKPV